MFDFPDYPPNHFLFSNQNRQVLGKFKDELNSEPALEFVGLKAKIYSLKFGKRRKKRAKCVSTHVVRKQITHQHYLDCLQKLKTTIAKQTRIGQEKLQIFTFQQNKIGLSLYDDKR